MGDVKILVVRSDQLLHLGKYERAKFIATMSKMLMSRFAHKTATMSVDALVASIDRGIDLASTYNIFLEADVARFLEFMIGLGDDFDIRPDLRWISEILRQTETEADARLDAVLERLASEVDGPWQV